MSAEHRKKSRAERRERCLFAGKYYYASKKQALTRAARAKNWEGFEIHVYKCQHCHGWHLTKSVDRCQGPAIAVQGSDLFDFDWKIFADAFATHLSNFLDRHVT